MKYLLIILLFFSKFTWASDDYKWGFGSGLGANYAYNPGINTSYRVDQVDFIVALGLQEHYTIGLNYNFRNQNYRWQPRIGLNYGSSGDLKGVYDNAEVEEGGYKDTFNGITLLIGGRLAFGAKRKHGVEFDIGYKITDGGYAKAEDRFIDENPQGSDGACGMIGCIHGLFAGSFDLQLSVGWKMYW